MSACTLCSLHTGVAHPLLPTRPFKEPTRSDIALLVVGEAPGFHEDESGISWSGESGTVLQRFISAAHLDDYADIYLSNACRCRPPQNVTPTKGQITKCRVHIASDLQSLQSRYKHVALFCCGAVSVTSICGKGSLTNSFRCQGTSLTSFPLGLMKTNPNLVGSPVFFTYHPAAVLVGRNPTLVHAMSDHFLVVRRWLENPTLTKEKSIPVEFGPDLPPYFSPYIVLDIETYGIIKGVNQTVFHPTKSRYIDKTPFGSQIETVGIRYEDESGTPHYCIYSWKKHLGLIRAWFHRISLKPDAFILGQNIPFDIMYLKANDSVCSAYLTPGKVRLMDTLLSSFLWFEQRPEKGLKELAALFGLVDYSESIVSGSSGTALSQEDPHLHYYNALDLYATDQLHTICLQEILKRYGKGTSKFSAICKTMCNEVLWDCITMGINGLCMDVPQLQTLHTDYTQKCTEAIGHAKSEGWILEGKGSDSSTRDLITKALTAANLMDDPRVKLTDKRKDIGVNVDNVNLIRSVAGPDFPFNSAIDHLATYTTYSKLVSSYTKPLLNNPKKGIVDLKSGMCYPTWYPIPLYEDRQDSSGSLGGTIQGRITCKQPAIQTQPEPIKNCICSRFRGGRITSYDLSQIELRIGALLSGDPVMIQEYQQDIDRHTETARLIFPHSDPHSPTFRKVERQAGKTLNFLVLYRGGASKYKDTLMRDVGIDLPLSVCESGIYNFDCKYPVFRTWQNDLIAFVTKHGYLEVPTGWSRTFATGRAADGYINEICNFPIQTVSAQILQNSQYHIALELHRRRMRTLMIPQIYDACYFDVPNPDEEAELDSIVHPLLTEPPLVTQLYLLLGRYVPIKYEKGH